MRLPIVTICETALEALATVVTAATIVACAKSKASVMSFMNPILAWILTARLREITVKQSSRRYGGRDRCSQPCYALLFRMAVHRTV